MKVTLLCKFGDKLPNEVVEVADKVGKVLISEGNAKATKDTVEVTTCASCKELSEALAVSQAEAVAATEALAVSQAEAVAATEALAVSQAELAMAQAELAVAQQGATNGKASTAK